MNAAILPTLPTSEREVGSSKTQQYRHSSDTSDTSDHRDDSKSENKGSLRKLVARWEAREGVEIESDETRHVLPTSSETFVYSPTVSLEVGSVGSVGIVLQNNGLQLPTWGVSRSEVSEGSSEAEQPLNPLAELREWAANHADEIAEWGHVPDLGRLVVPSEATVAGLLAGYKLRPRKP